MKKNIVRLLVLSALILLCIWQTNTLWLGDMSSHNFFESATHSTYEQYYVYPKQIWAVSSGFAYNIGGASKEEGKRYRLITELVNELKRDNVQITNKVEMTYANRLSKEGIVYEYGTTLALNELAGKELLMDKKVVDISFQTLFVDLSTSDSYRTNVYVIDNEGNVNYMLILNNKLSGHVDTLKHFTEDDNNFQMQYQPSLLKNGDNTYFKGNVFCSMTDDKKPTVYESIRFSPIITSGEEEKLSNMVSSLFPNPIYMRDNSTPTTIIFNDNVNLNVKYEKIGTLEFKKSTVDNTVKLTPMQRMNKIFTFIKETAAIPEGLKEGLYLNGILKDNSTGEVAYTFGYAYDNKDVIMTDHIKEQLGVTDYVELVIKNDQIIRGKWLMFEPKISDSKHGELTKPYNEVLDKIFELSVKPDARLSNLECAYIFNSLDDKLDFNWVYFWTEQ